MMAMTHQRCHRQLGTPIPAAGYRVTHGWPCPSGSEHRAGAHGHWSHLDGWGGSPLHEPRQREVWGWLLPSPVGWGLFLEAPFQCWAAAASWEEAGAPRCSEDVPGLPGGPGRELGGYSWLVPKRACKEVFSGCPHVGLWWGAGCQATCPVMVGQQVTLRWVGAGGCLLL